MTDTDTKTIKTEVCPCCDGSGQDDNGPIGDVCLRCGGDGEIEDGEIEVELKNHGAEAGDSKALVAAAIGARDGGKKLESGWHDIPSGGGVLIESGEPVRVSDGGDELLDPDTILAEAAELCGCELAYADVWDNAGGGEGIAPVRKLAP
jgi:hypothetical protein